MTEEEALQANSYSLTLMPHNFKSGAFDCGNEQINNALRHSLPRSISEGRSRAYYVDDGTGKCLGFISLRADSFTLDSIDREDFPITENEGISGVLLQLLGVDKDAQHKGLGKWLVLAAIDLTLRTAELVAARFLVLDSLPEKVSFYELMGFRRTYYQRDKTRETVFMVLDLLEP